MERRLAAILAADVVGYSRMMEQDEAGTLAALQARRSEILQPVVAKNRGRLVKFVGDGAIVEFSSAVHAVQCALELQAAMAAANAGLLEDRQIVLRIGINLGDVMVEDGDLYGDGVNIAARIEALAEPGAVHLSDAVFNQVQGKIEAGFEDTGEHRLKNIARPIRIYRTTTGAAVASTGRFGFDRPARPGIAVLPFVSMGGEGELRDFSEGFVEDITTELARFTSLMVVARNSAFRYRDQPIDVKRVGRELGARYLIEGSLRRLGPQIRITAQLIQAETGSHLWAERYDRKLEDLFMAQDEIVRSVVTAVEDRILRSEVQQGLRKPPQSWTAYDYVLQAHQQWDENDYLSVEAPLRRAIELDPNLAEAHALLTYPLLRKYLFGDEVAHLGEALESARKAIALNPQGSGPQFAMAVACSTTQDQYELAGLHYERAIALNPNNIYAKIGRAEWLLWGGKAEEALSALERSVQQEHFAPPFYWDLRGRILFQLRRYREALDAISRLVNPQFWVSAYVIAALAHLDRLDEARRQLAALMAAQPNLTIARVLKAEVYRDEALRDHLVEGLRKARLTA